MIIRHGALSSTPATPPMSKTFSAHPPAPAGIIRLNAAVADGQPRFTEGPMTFGGAPISPANAYDGSDGPLWDDDRFTVPSDMLPARHEHPCQQPPGGGDDCLAWAYTALSYQHLF